MQTDATTRLLLAGILVCLIVLVTQGFGSDSTSGGWPRYQVMGMRAGAPVLIRTDTVTGEVSKLELRAGRDRWVKLTDREEDEDEADTAQAEPGSTPPQPAPTAAAAPERPPRAAPVRVAPREALPARPAAAEPRAPGGPRAAKSEFTTLANAVRRSQLPRDVRILAVTQLAARGDPESTGVLLEALQDPDAQVVAAAVTALGPREDERVLEALDAARANPDPGVQEALDALESGE
jgi:hypothetical protein